MHHALLSVSKIISRYFKSIANCKVASQLADRTYINDNSVDGQEAQLLFRFVDGNLFKQYVEEIPEWVAEIAEQTTR